MKDINKLNPIGGTNAGVIAQLPPLELLSLYKWLNISRM